MKGLKYLEELATHAPEQLFRYAIDFDRQRGHDLGVTEWEKTEPGSLAAVLSAFVMTLSWIRQNKELMTVNNLKAIHAACASHLPRHIYQGQFRVAMVKFHILRDTVTEKGISYFSELKSLSTEERRQRGLGQIKLTRHDTLEYYAPMANLGDEQIHLLNAVKDQIDITYKQYHIKNNSLAMWVTLYDLYPNLLSSDHERQVKIYFQVTKTLHDFFQREMRNILLALDHNLSSSLTDRQKLYHIAKAVQDLERVHPFRDVNCRTFCMVFLNTLLIQNDFLPALITDINKFDGYDCDALVDLIEDGIARSEILQIYIQSNHNAETEANLATEQTFWCPMSSALKSELKDMVSPLQQAILSPESNVKETVSSSHTVLSDEERTCMDELMKKINTQFPGLEMSIHSPNELQIMHSFLMELKQLYLKTKDFKSRGISLAYIRLTHNYPEYMKKFSDVNIFIKFIENGAAQCAQNKSHTSTSSSFFNDQAADNSDHQQTNTKEFK